MAFTGEAGDEVPVHDDVAAMRVQMPLGELDGFTDHDAHRDAGDTFLFGKTESISDIVAVMYEGLRWEVGKTRAEVIFTLGPGVDNEFRASKGSGNLDLFAYGVDKSLGGEGADDTGSTDNRDSPGNAEFGIEGFLSEFVTSGYGYADGHTGQRAVGAEQPFDFTGNHAAGCWVDGGIANGYADAWKGDRADAFAGQESYSGNVCERDGGKNGVAVRDIRVVSGIFGNPAGATILGESTRADGKGYRFSIGKGNRGGVLWNSRETRVAAVAHEPVVNPLRRG